MSVSILRFQNINRLVGGDTSKRLPSSIYNAVCKAFQCQESSPCSYTPIRKESKRFLHTYHHALTPELRNKINAERDNATRKIDELMKLAPDRVSREGIENEIISASALQNSGVGSETGPTGKYEYSFRESFILGTRSYIRRDIASGEGKTVFSINFHLEELGPMSLSVDENFAVRLITYVGGGMKQRIVLRDINTGIDREIDLSAIYNANENGGDKNASPTPTRIHSVEFGPKLMESNNEELHTLFFTTCDEVGRPCAVHGCVVFGSASSSGTDKRFHSSPELILVENDASHFVDIQRTKGCDYVVIQSGSKTSNEIHVIGKELAPILVRKRQPGVQYFVDCGEDDDIVIMAHTSATRLHEHSHEHGDDSTDGPEDLAPEFSIFEDKIHNLPLGTSTLFRNSGSIVATSDTEGTKSGYFIEDMELFKSAIVVYERSCTDGAQRMRLIDRKSGNDREIPLKGGTEEGSHVVSSAGNMNYNSTHFEYIMESPVTPPMTRSYDLQKGLSNGSKEDFLQEKVDSNKRQFKSKRILVDVEEGIKCPLTIVYNSDIKMKTLARPILLIGYGCYGENQKLEYDPSIIPLVDRGFAIAYCHGRGGSELGQQWKVAGSHLNKINAVRDFIGCTKYLTTYTCSEDNAMDGQIKNTFIAAKAFSAGGVIVGASLNAHPELFQTVTLRCPFLDVRGTMLDRSLYLTEHEWDEFGDPRGEVADASISSYCPLLNVRNQKYPPILIVGAIDDESVPFHNALSFGQKIRDHHQDSNGGVLLNIENEGGHHLHGKSLQVSALEVSHILGQYYKYETSKSRG